jgi:hypothetical protein
MDERQERIGRNEALFREVNERVERLARDFEIGDEGLAILCECGDSSCRERIEVTVGEYEALRADPTQFAVVHGHAAPDVETAVGGNERYEIIRKAAGEPAELARELDPRS